MKAMHASPDSASSPNTADGITTATGSMISSMDARARLATGSSSMTAAIGLARFFVCAASISADVSVLYLRVREVVSACR